MAFSRNGFSRASSGVNDSNVVLYAYDTDDTIATVTASGYFNGVSELGGSDVILVTASDYARFLITTITGTTVTTAVLDDGNTPAAGSITSAMLAANSVIAGKYGPASITTADISATAGILGSQLASSTIVANNISANAVVTAGILDANVTKAKLAADSVDGTKIEDNALDSEHYTDGSIDAAHMAPGLVPLYSKLYTTTGGSTTETITFSGLQITDIVIADMNTHGATPVSCNERRISVADTIYLKFNADPGNDHKMNILVYRPLN